MPKDKRQGTLWEPVEASPEEIAKACMAGPPKENWAYLKHYHAWFRQMGGPPEWLKEEWLKIDPSWATGEELDVEQFGEPEEQDGYYMAVRLFSNRQRAHRYAAEVEADSRMRMVLQCKRTDCGQAWSGKSTEG